MQNYEPERPDSLPPYDSTAAKYPYREHIPDSQAINQQTYHPVFEPIYSNLKHPDATRVLTILMSSTGEPYGGPLRCQLNEIRLTELREGERYTALSYVWAQKVTMCPAAYVNPDSGEWSSRVSCVWFDQRRRRIGDNLFWALLHLRRQDRPVRLWVDALCINQRDKVEQNHQVQQMRDIYQKAWNTIIWLGPEADGNTDLAAWNFSQRHSSSAPGVDFEDADGFFRTPAGGDRDVDVEVLSRPWFRRLWVVQEAVVSPRLFLQCGYRWISWNDFCETLLVRPQILDRYSIAHLRDHGKRDIVRNMHLVRSEHLRSRGLSSWLPSWTLSETSDSPIGDLNILKLLARARHLEASDARDKIFGLLGIATDIDTSDARFAVDYRKSPRILYIDFARHVVEATRSFDILSYVDPAAETKPSRAMPLPSWVPNWDYQDTISYSSNRTILEGLPAEARIKKKLRQQRVERAQVHFSRRWPCDIMVAPGRIIGQIEDFTVPLRLLGHEEMAFQSSRNSTDEESNKISLVMELWRERFLFDGFSHSMGISCGPLELAEHYTSVKSPNGDTFEAVRSPRRAARFSALMEHSRVKTVNSVERHLYTRGRRTASWPESSEAASLMNVIVDKESVVDGKRLAICITTEAPCEQLALVPAWAEKGDLVVQISGSRVPFVVMAPPGGGWPGEIIDMSWMFEEEQTIEHVVCQLVGECVLNEFEEMPEERMSTFIAMY